MFNKMKIELKLGKSFGKKVCPLTHVKFTNEGPYDFIIAEGKYKGESVTPEIAMHRGFTMTPETLAEIQKDYSLARKSHDFLWDKGKRYAIAKILTDTRKLFPERLNRSCVIGPFGQVLPAPGLAKYEADVMEGMREMIDFLTRK